MRRWRWPLTVTIAGCIAFGLSAARATGSSWCGFRLSF
jgi:hypothetical protein